MKTNRELTEEVIALKDLVKKFYMAEKAACNGCACFDTKCETCYSTELKREAEKWVQ